VALQTAKINLPLVGIVVRGFGFINVRAGAGRVAAFFVSLLTVRCRGMAGRREAAMWRHEYFKIA